MVHYDADGRVVIEHEQYLETAAKREARNRRQPYTDQVDVYKRRQAQASTQDVRIFIQEQHFRSLYCERKGGWGSDFEWIRRFEQGEQRTIEIPLDRETLMLCSSTAKDYFTHNPGSNELHLPVAYPQVFEVAQTDDQIAYIRADEIERYIIPWLGKVRAHMDGQKHKKNSGSNKIDRLNKSQNRKLREYLTSSNGPVAMEIPDDLLEKIHLYNAMVQLGLPKFVQLPLSDALILQIYKTKLSECHLDTLEITIARFYSRGLAILDPVINHFIGTYSHRSSDDRSNPHPQGSRQIMQRKMRGASEKHSTDLFRADGTPETIYNEERNRSVKFRYTKRKYLEFAEQRVRRGDLGKDTYVLPPELPVLGHCIKHWSGIRADGTFASKRTEFPLNVGLQRKIIRRDVSIPVNVEDCEEVPTIRLDGFSVLRRRRRRRRRRSLT